MDPFTDHQTTRATSPFCTPKLVCAVAAQDDDEIHHVGPRRTGDERVSEPVEEGPGVVVVERTADGPHAGSAEGRAVGEADHPTVRSNSHAAVQGSIDPVSR